MGIKKYPRRLAHWIIGLKIDLSWRSAQRRGEAVIDHPPSQWVWVDPCEVRWQQQFTDPPPVGDRFIDHQIFDKWKAAGRVFGGGWDQQVVPFDQFPAMEACRLYFHEGVPWQKIELMQKEYERARRKARRNFRFGSPDRAFERRLKELSSIYNDFRKQKYIPQGELTGRIHDELAINIGRNGELIRNASAGHRLVLAQLAGLKRMPVRVVVCHELCETKLNSEGW